jgi:hypothetical protein
MLQNEAPAPKWSTRCFVTDLGVLRVNAVSSDVYVAAMEKADDHRKSRPVRTLKKDAGHREREESRESRRTL